jgi:hypothetical protein
VNDRPRAEELLREVERFLEREVVPALGGVTRFQARVAANVVAMVALEIETDDAHRRGEWERLAQLLGRPEAPPGGRDALGAAILAANETLVTRIRAGEADAGPWRREVLAHLARTVADKLEVSRPPRVRSSSPPAPTLP